jgi:hypothetical protein
LKINLIKLKEILEQQRKRDFMDRGMQPSLTYGCFSSLKEACTESVCEKCRSYSVVCETYLRSLELKEELFKKWIS